MSRILSCYISIAIKSRASENDAFCERYLEKYELCERSIFISEMVNFYALLLLVLLQILRIKRGETVYLCSAGIANKNDAFCERYIENAEAFYGGEPTRGNA